MKRALLAALLAIAVVAMAFPTEAAAAKPKATKPGASYFGMHYGSVGYGGSYPATASIGSLRLWDTGTSWRQIQPQRGTWDWSVMDRAVDNARAHGASVLYVLGSTPSWAAKDPDLYGFYGRGTTSPPLEDSDWVAYVRAVATRYRGRIGAYELWNESNLVYFYRGSTRDMVRLARLAYRTIKSVDRHAVVTGPSVSLRGPSGTKWMVRYAKQGGLRWADVANVHGYPMAEGTPETAMTLVRNFRRAMANVGVHKRIWNTEMNFAMTGKSVPRKHPLTANKQIAYVLRAYLLGWSGGVRRIYWYDWSSTPWLGIRMASSHSVVAPTGSGRAFSTVRSWMNGKVSPCTTDRRGTYSCVVTYGHGERGLVRWNPRRTVTVAAPHRTVRMIDQRGGEHTGRAAKRVQVGQFPVLFRYRA